MSGTRAAVATLALQVGVVLMLLGAWPVTAPLRDEVAATPVAAATAPLATATAPLPTASLASPGPTALAATTPLPPIPPGYRIQMPRLAIDLAILEGDVERDSVQQRTPDGFAFHLPGTGLPGSGMNSYIYAHARTGMFLSLWNARLGDVVWISTPDGRVLRYVVSEIHSRVSPNDVSWAQPSPPDRLTLQTSTGPNPADPRFVVVALPG